MAAARGCHWKIRRLVAEHLVRAALGENVINVMTLNAALDTLFPMSGMEPAPVRKYPGGKSSASAGALVPRLSLVTGAVFF
ncbi:MAG: hypothetical protein ACLT38_05250 [Akkermansia sp.]